MIKIGTVCTGIGSPEQAMRELGIDHEVVFGCEIDKYAKQTYLANFEPRFMLEDMTSEDWSREELYVDLFVGGIPCQAFSLAGKRMGELDPRGLLFYNFYDYVKKQRPKYFIIENVKGLLSDAGGKTFQTWLDLLSGSVNNEYVMFPHEDSLEYNVHWTVLNSKDFGVPQNRERVFIVGIRPDLVNDFRFPVGEPLKIRLKDVLEPVVDEKYYLSDKMLDWMIGHSDKKKEQGCGFNFSVKDLDGIGSAINARTFKMGIDDNYIQEPFCVRMQGRDPLNPSNRNTKGIKLEQILEPNSQGTTNTITSVQKDNLIVEPTLQKIGQLPGYESAGRIYSPEGLSPTVTAKQGGGHEPFTQTHNRIRRLTPLECFRLQGFPDYYYETILFHNNINKQGIYLHLCENLKKILCQNVESKNATENQKQGSSVLCTIKEKENTETQILFSNIAIEKMKIAPLKIAIETFSVKDGALTTITAIENMETQRFLMKKGESLKKIKTEEEFIQDTELFLKITLDENLKKENAYITLTVIPIIMKLITYFYSEAKQNTIGVILNYSNSQENFLTKESLVLKMANTLFISDTQTYKQAGNTITTTVIKAIQKNLLKNEL